MHFHANGLHFCHTSAHRMCGVLVSQAATMAYAGANERHQQSEETYRKQVTDETYAANLKKICKDGGQGGAYSFPEFVGFSG